MNGTSTQESKTFDQDRAARTRSLYLSGRSSGGSANTAAAQIDALAVSLSGDVDNWSGQAQGFGENPNSPIASRTISLGSDGIFNLGDGRYQLPSGRIAGVSTQLVSIDNNASGEDPTGFLYRNRAGDLVRGSGVSEVFNGLENNTNYVVPGAAQYQPSGGVLRYTFDSTGTAFWRAGDQILSIPLPFDRPSLGGLQASSFWDGAKNAPFAFYDGLSDLINGRVDFSNITARGFTAGLIRNSPIGILSTAAFDGDYKAAGERSGGLAIGGVGGFGARLAAPAVARGVTATAQWAAPVAARYLETYAYRTGISSYIVPPGANSTANFAANEIRFSQNSVSFGKVDRATGQAFTYDELVTSMRTNGWKGDPVDVVRMQDGRLTSIDNTRIRAAREAGIDVQANVRAFDSPLTASEIGRFTKGIQIPSTWGDAVTIRINSQTNGFGVKYPYGADTLPRVTGRPK